METINVESILKKGEYCDIYKRYTIPKDNLTKHDKILLRKANLFPRFVESSSYATGEDISYYVIEDLKPKERKRTWSNNLPSKMLSKRKFKIYQAVYHEDVLRYLQYRDGAFFLKKLSDNMSTKILNKTFFEERYICKYEGVVSINKRLVTGIKSFLYELFHSLSATQSDRKVISNLKVSHEPTSVCVGNIVEIDQKFYYLNATTWDDVTYLVKNDYLTVDESVVKTL